MAKQRRSTRPAAKSARRVTRIAKPAVKRTAKRVVKRAVKSPGSVAGRKASVAKAAPAKGVRGTPEKRAAAPAPAVLATPAAAPAPPRKPGFYEAVAIYERGVQALQRHDFKTAADFFRTVLARYPEERELLERARLYLRVSERETERQAPPLKTPGERVYAATVALNSGDHAGALDHLKSALSDDPESDHAHYIMAVALGMRGHVDEGLDHLRSAIALNPENRGLARQDPDLDRLRDHATFRTVLDTPPSPNRRRPRPRR
jgi:tetratricopeptide (TPR) repeat protein